MTRNANILPAMMAGEAFARAVPQALTEADLITESIIDDNGNPVLVVFVDEAMIDDFVTQVGTAVPVMRRAPMGLLDIQDVRVEYQPINQPVPGI